MSEGRDTDTGFEAAYDPGAEDRRIEEQKTAQKLAEAKRLVLTRLLLDSEARAFLWDLITDLKAFETPAGITPTGQFDPFGTGMMIGTHKAGWWIWQLLDDAAPELASRMRRENRRLDDVLRDKIA